MGRKHSLEIFSLGTLLSFLGWIALTELGSNQMTMWAVNVAGIAIMGLTAWQMSHRRQSSRGPSLAASRRRHRARNAVGLFFSLFCGYRSLCTAVSAGGCTAPVELIKLQAPLPKLTRHRAHRGAAHALSRSDRRARRGQARRSSRP